MKRAIKSKILFKTANLFKNIATVLAPPPELLVSEWADAYRRLSPEASAEPGRWRTDRAPYQRDIMDAVNDSQVETIVIMSSAQVGKSEIILNTLGYFIDYDPSPILLLQPTEGNAKDFSKDRIATMIRDTPSLKGKVDESKTRDSGNTMLHKTFPGGHLTLVGANSPAGLASRPIRILLADEIDRFPVSAGSEGDPLSLAEKRTKTFWNRKKIFVSTPTIKGASKIEKEFLDTDQAEWCLPCPCCGRYQPLTWGRIRFSDVTMECEFCKENSSEREWKEGTGKWISQAGGNPKRKGFHLNALASPWEPWDVIIENFKEAKKKGTEELKTWINTTLGEVWEDQDGEFADEEELMKRRQSYNCEVPKGVLLLTCGVDVQDDRLELEVVGWGVGKVSWGIEYKVLLGDPGQNTVWEQLDRYLQKEFHYEDGSRLLISSTCIDSGGHHTDDVYTFCKSREHRRIYAIKGQGGTGYPFLHKYSRNNKQKVLLVILGVDSGKETILSRLKVSYEDQAGYCHFPIEESKGYGETYFKALTSEAKKTKHVNGQKKIYWKKRRKRNEALDIRNYATAALEVLSPDLEQLKLLNKNGNVYAQNPKPKKKRRRVHSKGI